MITVALIVFAGFVLGAFMGAPFLPVGRREVAPLLELAEIKPGETLLDLGSGDGRLLIAAAQRGAHAIGYELNPWLFVWSWLRTRRYASLVQLHLGDYWRQDWPAADVIYVFLIRRYMPKLASELSRRIRRPTRVVSYVFAIPGQEAHRRTPNAWLYLYPN